MKNDTSPIHHQTHFILFFITLFLLIDLAAYAQGDLLVFPKRLVFEGRTRVEKVTLSNTGDNKAVYNVSFLEYRMTEAGNFLRIDTPDVGQHFASPYLKVYPRRVELEPGESQTVKVQLNRTEEMIDGEYRSHLYFRAEKNNTPWGRTSDEEQSSGIAIKLDAVFGISIATIIRRGECQSEATISDLTYLKDEASNRILDFTINRTGNASIYGDIIINHINAKGKVHEVAYMRGIGIYTPNAKRHIKLLLKKPIGVDLDEGDYEVILKENEKKTVLAQAGLEL